LWGRNPEKIRHYQQQRENSDYLPGIPFPDNLSPILDWNLPLTHDPHAVLIVTPTASFRTVVRDLKHQNIPISGIAWASKGLEPETGTMKHIIVQEELGEDCPTAMLSGPTFAREVANNLPTAITIASKTPEFAKAWAQRISSGNFRAYTNPDIIGVEIAATCKNVIAIAAGISDGLAFGANARAAIITRGLQEIIRLGLTLGADKQTFMGLAGLGDLVLTCSDNQSRNRQLGLQLAEGHSVAVARHSIAQETEGVHAATIVNILAQRHKIEMPICQAVYQILAGTLTASTAAEVLLQRELKAEVADLI
jgi:glycerol-3-phosphate dehydrogenase (NAD(P)+)